MEFEDDDLPDEWCVAALEAVEYLGITSSPNETISSLDELSRVKYDGRSSSSESQGRRDFLPAVALECLMGDGESSSVEKWVSRTEEVVDEAKEIPLGSLQVDESLHEFDEQAGLNWIYPVDYPVRDYQLNIVQKSLFWNTLVMLPTGLGKTFIASVVMYNFYRWFPKGKVLFMAPTRPLVAQQIEACRKIVGIPIDDIVELTGSNSPEERKDAWKEKSVFFLTPQILVNDLHRDSCCARQIVCIVLDEAHRALGDYAYCTAIRSLSEVNRQFRIVALSATPGSDAEAVRQVIQNLRIAHLEIRTEESLDLREYIHERKTEIIRVPLGENLNELRDRFLSIFKKYISRLCQSRVLFESDPEKITQGVLLRARDVFRSSATFSDGAGRHTMIEGDFGIAISLCHAYQLLHQHGARSFFHALENLLDDTQHGGRISRSRLELIQNREFLDLIDLVKTKLDDPSFRSHGKFYCLEKIVLDYFGVQNSQIEENRRLMIFSQYRNSVSEIVELLSQYKGIRVASFIGQSSTGKTKGFSQKRQLEVIQRFREGYYNTLVSTSIGEEGLDIGEIDLILCFDAQFSVVRTLQRIGRTGRQREGRIVMLLTEGKEEQIYQRNQTADKNVQKSMISEVTRAILYRDNPRMVPSTCKPILSKVKLRDLSSHFPIPNSKEADQEPARLTFDRFRLVHLSRSPSLGPYLSPDETQEWKRRYKLNSSDILPQLNLDNWIEHQVVPSAIYQVPHSMRTHQLVDLLSRNYASFANKIHFPKTISVSLNSAKSIESLCFRDPPSKFMHDTEFSFAKINVPEASKSPDSAKASHLASLCRTGHALTLEETSSPGQKFEDLDEGPVLRPHDSPDIHCIVDEINMVVKAKSSPNAKQFQDLEKHFIVHELLDDIISDLSSDFDYSDTTLVASKSSTTTILAEKTQEKHISPTKIPCSARKNDLLLVPKRAQEDFDVSPIGPRRRRAALIVVSQEDPTLVTAGLKSYHTESNLKNTRIAPSSRIDQTSIGCKQTCTDFLGSRKPTKRRKNQFIDDEASLDDDIDQEISRSSDCMSQEDYASSLSGFIVPDNVFTTPSSSKLTGMTSVSSPADMTSFYQQSLLSPSNTFFKSKLQRNGNRFKMVFGARTPSSMFSGDSIYENESLERSDDLSSDTLIGDSDSERHDTHNEKENISSFHHSVGKLKNHGRNAPVEKVSKKRIVSSSSPEAQSDGLQVCKVVSKTFEDHPAQREPFVSKRPVRSSRLAKKRI